MMMLGIGGSWRSPPTLLILVFPRTRFLSQHFQSLLLFTALTPLFTLPNFGFFSALPRRNLNIKIRNSLELRVLALGFSGEAHPSPGSCGEGDVHRGSRAVPLLNSAFPKDFRSHFPPAFLPSAFWCHSVINMESQEPGKCFSLLSRARQSLEQIIPAGKRHPGELGMELNLHTWPRSY